MSVILSNKDGKLKQCFQRKTMPPKLQIDLASILTVLYCVTMMQAEKFINYFKGEHEQTQFWSNFKYTKCCGYLEYKVKVIEI